MTEELKRHCVTFGKREVSIFNELESKIPFAKYVKNCFYNQIEKEYEIIDIRKGKKYFTSFVINKEIFKNASEKLGGDEKVIEAIVNYIENRSWENEN